MTSAALALCGVLGPGYWVETIRTIGMVLVAVVLCATLVRSLVHVHPGPVDYRAIVLAC